MSFKRDIAPKAFATGEELTADLIGIGFRLHGRENPHGNIENTVFAASIEGMNGDLRVLSLLVDWLDIHGSRLLVDRLTKLVKRETDPRVRAFWTAIAKSRKTDSRFRSMSKIYRGPRVDLLRVGTDFHIARHGEDARFIRTTLRVPAQAGLRRRQKDILSPAELAHIHRPYYYRLLIGATPRADTWAHIELSPELTATELAKRCHGSFATAWNVKNEFEILRTAA